MKRVATTLLMCLFLLAGGLTSGCAKSEPPAGAVEVLDEFFQAFQAKNMIPAMELIDPVLLQKDAARSNISVADYKGVFAENLNQLLEGVDFKSYKFTQKRKLSETKWEIYVQQVVGKKTEEGSWIVIKSGDKWYIAAENF